MNKVIIITRSNEYGSYEPFNTAIEENEKCAYNNKTRLYCYLEARRRWKEALQQSSAFDAYKNCFGDSLYGEDEKDIRYKAISQFMNQTDTPDLPRDYCPYASFINGSIEVILVLCDKIGILSEERVIPEKLFIQSICGDVPVEGKDNILYIHDNQIGLRGDGILVENNSPQPCCPDWMVEFTDRFKRIGCFYHSSSYRNIFSCNIVNLAFEGKTV